MKMVPVCLCFTGGKADDKKAKVSKEQLLVRLSVVSVKVLAALDRLARDGFPLNFDCLGLGSDPSLALSVFCDCLLLLRNRGNLTGLSHWKHPANRERDCMVSAAPKDSKAVFCKLLQRKEQLVRISKCL